jgi:hypothetical protein
LRRGDVRFGVRELRLGYSRLGARGSHDHEGSYVGIGICEAEVVEYDGFEIGRCALFYVV